MEQINKSKISLYGIISAVAFMYLILNNGLGISVPVFFVIQFAVLFIISQNNEAVNIKGLLMMIPIFIISLNNFISASFIPTNFLAIIFLYSVMFLLLGNKLNLMKLNILGIIKIVINIFEPIINFIVPFKWIAERTHNKEKNVLVKRILIGVLISIPAVIFLVMMLSSADLVFYNSFIEFINRIIIF